VLNLSSKRFSFGFAPDCSGKFCSWMGNQEGEFYLQNLNDETSQLATGWECWPSGVSPASILVEYPALFSLVLGMAHCTPYEIE